VVTRCGVDHDIELLPLSYGIDDETVIVQCVCGQEWADVAGALAPVDEATGDDYDHDDQTDLELDGHWGPLLSGVDR